MAKLILLLLLSCCAVEVTGRLYYSLSGRNNGRGPPSGRGRPDSRCPQEAQLLQAPEGNISSPLFGHKLYSNNLHCAWVIEVPQGQTIELTVTYLQIEEGYCELQDDEYCCVYDMLILRDGPANSSPEMAAMCGNRAPARPFRTTGNQAYVAFQSDVSGRRRGFFLEYRIFVQQGDEAGPARSGLCPEQPVVIRDEGTLASPGFSDGTYTNNDNCKWRIVAPVGYVIHLTFDQFQIEAHSDCSYDRLELYDGSDQTAPQIGPFCGTNKPEPFDSRSNNLMVTFKSDYSVNSGGFSMQFDFIDPDESANKVHPGCNGTAAVLDDSEGSFSSPEVAGTGKYPDDASCGWLIKVTPGRHVKLHFETFALEEASEKHCYDYVTVYDGSTKKAKLLGYYCGRSVPADVFSSKETMLVEFYSDGSVMQTGFKANYAWKKDMTDGGDGEVTPAQCGIQAIQPKMFRIVGGDAVIPHSWPWQISMRYRYHNNFGHWCGGSIIARNWVITAAHCVHSRGDKSNFKVIVGKHDQRETEESQRTIELSELIIHEYYNPSTIDFDVALFRLAENITFTNKVSPVCLGNADVMDDILCTTTGWGATEGTADSNILQQVRVPVIDRATCNQADWYNGRISDNMFCAGYPEGRKDSCQGDSGGPLVCSDRGAYRLQGLTSWGIGCADARRPGVYTRVTKFLEWIESKTGVQPV